MYHRVRQDILARIRRGEFHSDGRLPSEHQLCEQYEVSLTTVRRALLELVKEGSIYRQAGVGTLVSSHPRQLQVAFLSIGYIGEAWRQVSDALGELIRGIGECAWQSDVSFGMNAVHEDESEAYLRNFIKERPADGVLLRTANDIDPRLLSLLEGASIPYVVIKRRIPGYDMNCVISDDKAGARMATSHLLNQGHRRVGFVCAKPHLLFNRERLAGYRDALIEHHISFDQSLVRQEPDFTTEMGYRAIKSLLEIPAPPSAIFVASDTMALGGYQAAHDLGLAIPEDVAFVGYDDIAAVAALQPQLTTVRTSYYDFGRLSAQLLIDLIEGRTLPPQQRVLKPTLMVRGSCGGRSRDVSLQPNAQDGPNSQVSRHFRGEGRLAGKVVIAVGIGEESLAGVARTLTAEGARLIDRTEIQGSERDMEEVTADSLLAYASDRFGRVDALFYCIEIGTDMDAKLDMAMLYGDAVARWLAEHMGGALIFLASLDTEGSSVEVARTGLEYVVRLLASKGRPKEVRANGLLYIRDGEGDGNSLIGPAVFLASDDAAAVSGQVLDVDARALGVDISQNRTDDEAHTD